jgi:hypothetical protein
MLRSASRLKPCILALALAVVPGRVFAADHVAGPEDYRGVLPRLAAGDRLLLRAGDYRRGLPLHGLAGEPGRPILIEGPASGPPARFIARSGANTVSLLDVRHIHLANLELDGGNLPVDAVKAEGHGRYAHFVTLENLHIHDHAASQQSVGISTKSPAFGWVIRNNRIERVGTGMYLGDSDGSDPFVGGLIEGNRISATLGYSLQIKHQKARQPDLPSADARHDTIIRRNLFDKAQTSLPGPLARPNVLLGHMPPEGRGMDDRYLVYANLFWRNQGESLFQGEGNLALYNNLFVSDGPDALRIQPHNGIPRNTLILFNTLVASGNGITVRVPEHNIFTQIVAGNRVFAARPMEGGRQIGNLSQGFDAAGLYLLRPHAEIADLDLSLLPGRRSNGAAAAAVAKWRVDLPEFSLDPAGTPARLGIPLPPRRP